MKAQLRRGALVASLAAVLSMGTAAFAEDGEVIVFDWAGYEDPAFHPDFATKYGDSPSFAFFGDEDEAFEKLRSGFRADVAHPCAQSIVKWRDAGLLQPLDTSRLTHWNDTLPGFRDMRDLMTTEDGQAWFLPFDWGNTVVTYRTDKIQPEEIKSLKAFADPKFKDRVSMPDNVDDAYAFAALSMGIKDWTTMTEAQVEEASNVLREVHKNVRMYWTDNTELSQAMGGGEVDLAWAWNETATTLSAEGVPVAMFRDTDEGLSTWVCGYVLLKDAPGNIDKAYDFLNAVSAPNVSAYMVTEWGYGHGNARGMAEVDPAVLTEKGYADVEKFKENTLFGAPLKPEIKAKMIADFEKIKAGY